MNPAALMHAWLGSLKVRIALLCMSVFLLAIGGVAWVAASALRADMEGSLAEQQITTATAMADILDAAVQVRLDDLQGIADGIGPELMANPVALQAYLSGRKQKHPLFSLGLYVLSTQGLGLAELPALGRRGADFSERDYFREALTQGRPAIGKVATGGFSPHPVLDFAVPIRGAAGQVVGVLVGANALEGDNIFNRVARLNPERAGRISIISLRDRQFVNSNDPAWVLKPFPPGDGALLDRFFAGDFSTGIATAADGGESLISARQVPAAGWIVTVVLPTGQAFAPILARQRTIYLSAALLAVLASVLVGVFIRRELRPLEHSAALFLGMSRGEQQLQSVPLQGSEEIRNLQAGFNRLQEQIQHQQLELRESETRLRIVFQTIPDLLWLKNARGVYLSCNPAFEALLGRPATEIVGHSDRELMTEEQADFVRSHDLAAIAKGGPHSNEEWVTFAHDGRRALISTTKVPVITAEGELIGVLGIGRDVTERQATESMLRANSEALQQSNTNLEQFAYSVSHDMRQPLRMITGHLQLLARALKGRLDEDNQANLEFALDGARRMDAMIVSLLDYSRVGRKTDSKRMLDTRSTLDDALGLMAPAIEEVSAQIVIRGEWPPLFASSDELVRLFMNLVGNAVKYREPDTVPQIDILSSIRLLPAPAVWQVRVTDQGIGIDPRQMDRLFQFFSRLQSRSRFEGTGMGLALCRKIVEHHGGRIWVESEGEGKGSCFVFELPLVGDVA